jgi:hypothetical protein
MSTATTTMPNIYDLEVHPACAAFPLMSTEDLHGLKNDLDEHKQQFPLIVYQNMLLDGRHRRSCLQALGVPAERVKVEILEELPGGMTPEQFVLSCNLHRRHLTSEQKRAAIGLLLKKDPAQNDREIGRKVKADGKTVASVRKELEGRAEIPHVKKRKDSKGRQQPAAKPRTKKAKPDQPKVAKQEQPPPDKKSEPPLPRVADNPRTP